MKRLSTLALLSGASLAAFGALSPAIAQDDPETSDEIVVTATGRQAALQDVPLAVTAVSGEQLENAGVQDLRDLTQLAPSFEMGTGQSSAATTARIRGIGTGGDNVGFENAVGIFIDGVYRARAGAALADLPDMERVEILRGPQGTLFGRNTSAGAVSVVTASPEFEPGMYLEGLAAFDDLEEVGARAGVNIPVSDSLAFSFDASIRARDGYVTDLISGEDINTSDRWFARGQALWDISNTASLRVIVDASEADEVCCGVTPFIYGSTQGAINAIVTGGAVTSPTGLTIATPAINPEGRGMTVSPSSAGLPSLGPGLPAQPGTPRRDLSDVTEDFGVSAQLDWDLGGIHLTSITAYRDWQQTRGQDIDFNYLDIAYRDGVVVGVENFTQEIRLQGEYGRVNWLAGLFYSDETVINNDRIRIGAQANLFANALAQGGTAPLAAIGGPAGGCQLFDSGAPGAEPDAIPSFFYCASDNPATPLVFDPNPALASFYLSGYTAGDGQQRDDWQADGQSLSAFTHNEISLTDRLMLTVGARFTHETKEVTADLNSVAPACDAMRAIEIGTDPFIGGAADGVGLIEVLQSSATAGGLMNIACSPAVNPIANGQWAGDSEENEWGGTVSLAYELSEDAMLYGSYSRGYKAGGYNLDRQGFFMRPDTTSAASLNIEQTHFDPEFTDAYEIGLKSTLFDGTTTLNLSAFYQQIHDYQLNAFNGFNFITRNVPEMISQGAELELATHPIEGLTISGGLTYTDAYFDSEVRFNPLTAGLGAADPNAVFEGQPLALSPEWTATTAIAYEMPLSGDIRALFYLDGRWNSEYRTQTLGRDPLGRTDNEAFAIFNGRIGVGPEDERWSVEFWGRNLTDEFYYVGSFQATLQNTYVIYPSEPQTYGVTLRARY
jgi:outer membrane receptor protein involved in Fe transport